ncbi:DNA topoisomerase III [Marinomonas sp. MED121]|uniref:DNA topoisomerase III n=1 Tax=Marinomonas sp. MED121 TaxID=314277 RepID=UPI000068FC16|nr:DNA topoisomerase III [Marinomonas sp. MED121]EAQ63839.1 DNA topoisomerase III [Marinomonas sp. MED121]
MILYIAEKPSLARAIASAFPKPQKKEDGCIWLPNGDCVSWCIGHLLEQAEPDAYNPAYKSWQLDHLPIVPDTWQWQEKSKTRKQLSVLKKLIKKASQLVHAGDPDREGQLLVDEVIHYSKVSKAKQDTIQRLLINDLTPSAVKKSLNQLRSNKEFSALSRSALARSRADWLHGINLTRAYTIKGKQGGYQGVLSIGRVQTPILGLVVKRDLERENFIAKDFYQVLANIETPNNEKFKAKWIPSDACAPHMDSEGRVQNKALAENVIQRIKGQDAKVSQAQYKKKRQAPPLPYNLSSLQIDAAKAFSMSAQQVLDTCQSLYEKHQLITYPRSDSRYLPNEQFRDAPAVIKSLKNNLPQWQEKLNKANTSQRSKAWNDKEVQAHHAIIPTSKQANIASLSQSEQKLYELIARQYLMQFYPHYEYLESFIELIIAGGLFRSKGHTPLESGWKLLLPEKKAKQDDDESHPLPQVSIGDNLFCHHGEILAKVTTPPPAFTDASLLAAMTGISRYVQQPDIKAILKETDGLGTEATRASIIELLFRRNFLIRQGKSILSTSTGKALINSLPESLITPDMTAKWEAELNHICQGSGSYAGFMTELKAGLKQLIEQAKTTDVSLFSALPSPTKKPYKKKGAYRKTSTKNTKKPKTY